MCSVQNVLCDVVSLYLICNPEYGEPSRDAEEMQALS
jgi:hypothetical protein